MQKKTMLLKSMQNTVLIMVYGHFDLIIIWVLLKTPFYPHFIDSANETKRYI